MVTGIVSGLTIVDASTRPTVVDWSPSPLLVHTVAPAATGIATIRIIAAIIPLPPSLSGDRLRAKATPGMISRGATRWRTSPVSSAVGRLASARSAWTGTCRPAVNRSRDSRKRGVSKARCGNPAAPIRCG